jgi:integrase
LFTRWKLAPNTVTQRLAALRFFYVQVLKRGWSVAETPYPKKVLHLPQVLSQEEVARLIDAAEFPLHRILLMTLYATGARRAEVAQLKIRDIDSRRMVIHIRGGKGREDRDVMLSPKLLEALRVYWRGLKRKPTDWLFPGNRWHTASHPVSTKVLWHDLSAGRRPSRCYSGIATWRKLRSICISPGAISAPPAVRWMRSPSEEKENRHRAHEPASLWQCPLCGGTMQIVERLSAQQLLLRSPPHLNRCAA